MLKVVSFNILCGDKPDGYSIDERAPRVKTLIDRYEPDLVGFQEATAHWMDHIRRDYGEKYEIINVFRTSDPDFWQEGTPLMWKKERFECLETGHFWLSDTPDIESGGWDTWGNNRICMWARLLDKQDGSVVAFFNTHYGFGEENQVKSSKLITDHVKAVKADASIVTADFNMRPDAPAYRKITEELVDVNGATVNDRRHTFHNFKEFKPGENPYHIDYVFATPDTVEPLHFKIIDELVEGKYPSDHYGIYAELAVHEPLKLISYNVKNCGHEPEERAKMLARLLRKYNPDLIGLQEVTPVFEAELSKLSRYGMFLQYRLENQKEATPILWNKEKFDVVHQEYFWLSETPDVPGKGFGAQYVRIANLMVLQYKGSNRRICLLNSHYDGGEPGRLSLAFVREKLAPYGEMPVFLTGDFNMMCNAPAYKEMLAEYKDVRYEVAPADGTPTTNGFDAQTDPPRIIDYVFTNGVRNRPVEYKVLTDRPRGKLISDHYGVFTKFIIE